MRWIAFALLIFTTSGMTGCMGFANMLMKGGNPEQIEKEWGPPVRRSFDNDGNLVRVYQIKQEEDLSVIGPIGFGLIGFGVIGPFAFIQPEEGYPINYRVSEVIVIYNENDRVFKVEPPQLVSVIAYYPKTGRYEQAYPPP